MFVLLYNEKTKEHFQHTFGAQEKFIMKVSAYQRRQLAGYNKSGWLGLASGPFELPQKFSQESRYVLNVSLDPTLTVLKLK